MKTTPALLLPLLLLVACNRDPAPQPAVAPGPNAPAIPATATLDGATLDARLIDTASLGAAIAGRYGIVQGKDRWLLLITLRDKDGNGVPAAGVQVDARAGGLTDAPQPVVLRAIGTDGLHDWVGIVEAKAPTTVRIEVDARRDTARADLRFSRDLPAQ